MKIQSIFQFQFNKKSAPVLSLVVNILASIAPNLYLPFDFSKPEWFSGDPVVQQESKEDKYLWHGSPRFGHALKMLDAIEKVSNENTQVFGNFWREMILNDLHSITIQATYLCQFSIKSRTWKSIINIIEYWLISTFNRVLK